MNAEWQGPSEGGCNLHPTRPPAMAIEDRSGHESGDDHLRAASKMLSEFPFMRRAGSAGV